MDALQFCYWCQGYLEVQNPRTIKKNQLQEIKNHVDLVLNRTVPKEPNDYMKQEYCSTQKVSMLGSEGKMIEFNLSGINPINYGKSQKDKENEQIYITVTNKPIWNSRSSYSYWAPISENVYSYAYNIISGFTNNQQHKKAYLLIDNDLSPKPIEFNYLKGANNHLTMPGKTCGILNVGTFNDWEGLVC